MKQSMLLFLLCLGSAGQVQAQDPESLVGDEAVKLFMSEFDSASTPEQTLVRLHESIRARYTMLSDMVFDPQAMEDLSLREKQSLDSLIFDEKRKEIAAVRDEGLSRYLFDQGQLKQVVHEFPLRKKLQMRHVCVISLQQKDMALQLSYDSQTQSVYRIAVRKKEEGNADVQVRGLSRYCKSGDTAWLERMVNQAALRLKQPDAEDPLAAL